eukprot:TRINITY_DN7481_c0_g2_i1.p1 TRINITY_DN7481_c0_g2~~TRINITY_DN7481_c0_g2_i1.p1  ORF type:complete len:223 (-),score=25.52 TRINITY_DN7481_c0_g2_i1:91-759(-)
MGTMPPPSDLVSPAAYQQAVAMGVAQPPPPPQPVAPDFKPYRPQQGAPANRDKLMSVLGIALRAAIVLFAVLSFGCMGSILSEPSIGTDHAFNFIVAAMVLTFLATSVWAIVAILQVVRVLDLQSNPSMAFGITFSRAISDLVFLLMAVSASSAVGAVASTHYCNLAAVDSGTYTWCPRVRATAAFGFLASFSQLAVLLISAFGLHKLLAPQPPPQGHHAHP